MERSVRRAGHSRYSGPERERGSIIIFTTIALLVLMASTAMGVDIAREVSRKRTVEEVADIATRDASQAFKTLDGATTNNIATIFAQYQLQFPSLQANHYYDLAVEMVRQSLIRNGFLATTALPTGCQGTTQKIVSDGTNYALVTISYTPQNGSKTTVPCDDPAGTLATQPPTTTESIVVAPYTTLKWMFLPGSVTLSANSQHDDTFKSCSPCGPTCTPCNDDNPANGQFDIGSYLARETLGSAPAVADANAFLGAALGLPGNDAGLSAASYQGLATESVALESLAKAAGFDGRPDQLLAQTITMSQLLTYIKAGMNNEGDTVSTGVLAIGTLVSDSPTLSQTFKLGDLLGTSSLGTSSSTTGGTGYFAARYNLASLVEGALELALVNGQHLVSMSLPVTGVGGVASASVKFGLIEPPQLSKPSPGPAKQNADGTWVTTSNTAQIRAQLTITLTGGVQLPIYLQGARADGSLTSLTCDSVTANQKFTVHASTAALTAQIGTVSSDTQLTTGSSGSVTVNNTNLSSLTVLGVGVNLVGSGSTTFAGNSGTDLQFPVTAGDFSAANDVRHINPASLGGNTNVTITPTLASGGSSTVLTNALVTTATSTLATQINAVLLPPVGGGTASIDQLVTPLFNSLGLSVAGADVTGYAPYCKGP